MELKEITELTIDREHWVHGGSLNSEILGGSKLLNDVNKMCCLGFMCRALGVPDLRGEDNWLYTTPYSLTIDTKEALPGLVLKDGYSWEMTDLNLSAMNINDNYAITKEERETKLTELFKEHGIALTFEGEYPEGVK